MPTEEITPSQWKMALYLLGSLVFVVGGGFALYASPEKDTGLILAVAFFGLCAAVFLWVLVRPQRLILDGDGFMVAGGFVRTPKSVRWTDIEPFHVYRLPKGGKMIGYNYRPESRKDSALMNMNRRFGADGALPKGWAGKPEDMAARLNDYRERALARHRL